MPTLIFTQEGQALQLKLYFPKEIPKHSPVQTKSGPPRYMLSQRLVMYPF